MTARDAITEVRQSRAHSVETVAQEETVALYYQSLYGNEIVNS